MLNEDCRGLTLFSFLIKPVQRICKYPLLLKDLLNHTKEDHPDYDNLVQALPKINTVVEYVNERKRLAENLQKIMDVQNQIESTEELNLVEPTRRFVREGTLKVIENGRTRERNTYVFNDLVVLTKGKKNLMGNKDLKDHFKAQFRLNDIQIVDVADTDERKNACEVRPKNGSNKTFSFTFVFPTPNEKAEWVKEIKRLVREFQKKEAQARKEALEKGEPVPAIYATEAELESAEEKKKGSFKIPKKGSQRSSLNLKTPPKNIPYQKPDPPGAQRGITGRPAVNPPPSKTSSSPLFKKLLSRDSLTSGNGKTSSSKDLSKKLAKTIQKSQSSSGSS